jgi:hypothetical protein
MGGEWWDAHKELTLMFDPLMLITPDTLLVRRFDQPQPETARNSRRRTSPFSKASH